MRPVIFGFKGESMKKMEIRSERQSTPVPTGMPWLVIPSGKNQKNQTFCTISAPSSSNTISTIVELKTIPDMRKAEFRACYHGWLLFTTEEDDHSWRLWNPTTYESIKLPPTNKKMVKSCIFTTSPQNPQCRVLLFHYNAPTIAYCQPGDREWVTYDYREKLLEIDSNERYEILKRALLHDMACLDGVIYAITSIAHLISIEFDNQIGLILNCVVPDPPRGKFWGSLESFLIESFGELFIVEIYSEWNTVFGVQIFRWNLSQKVWLQVERLDNRLIFLGSGRKFRSYSWLTSNTGNQIYLMGSRRNSSSCSCLTAGTGIRGNRIYFMMPKNELLYMYDIEEQTILASLSCPKPFWYKPFWVMPNYPDMNLSHDKISKVVEKTRESVVESHHVGVDFCPHILNLDMFTEIAKHLKPLDYLQFRATSNLFRSAAPTTQWSINSITCALESPWLVTFSYNNNFFSFTDPKYNNTYHMKVPESLLGTHVNGSKDGYLLMVKERNYFYFNPFTGSHVELPSPFSADKRYSFSFSPSSLDCLVVRIHIDSRKYGDTSYVQYLLPGSDWNIALLGYVSGDFKTNGEGVFHREMFYYLGQGGNLGVLKNDDTDGFSFKILEKPEVLITGSYHNYLVECNEELMAIFVGRNGNWVKVFRLDQSEMRWLKVWNLGNYTIFVSNTSSIAAVARSRGMENKIYFPRFYNERVVYYSLETKKFHTHGDNTVLKNFFDTKEKVYCTWIEPNCVDSKEQISLNWNRNLEELQP